MINKISFVNNQTSRYFGFYLRGFPKKFLIYDILPVQSILLIQKELFLNKFGNCSRHNKNIEKCALDMFDHTDVIRNLFFKRLNILKETSIASAADFLCLIDYDSHEIGLCSIEYLKFFKNSFEFFFDSEDHLEIVYIYFRCLAHGIKLKEDTLIKKYNKFCPNPCKPLIVDDFDYENNPCLYKKNVQNTDCLVNNPDFILYDNNYKCNCKPNFEWNALIEECVFIKTSCQERNICNKKNSIACHVNLHSRQEVAVRKYEYEMNCECLPLYMGTDCSQERNACVKNYYSNYPSGNVACGIHGECIPLHGTNNYKCKCDSGWFDDINNDYLDCYENIDKCSQIYCNNNGYCKSSVTNEVAICVCDQKYIGSFCEIPRPMWLQWELWSECQPKCGFDRIRKRTRKCPSINYKNKQDNSMVISCYFSGDLGPDDFQLCEFLPCPNESKWSTWEAWSKCSKNCDLGLSYRKRHCIFKHDMHLMLKNQQELFKTPCIGQSKETKYCNLGKCDQNTLDFIFITIICLVFIKFLLSTIYYCNYFIKMFKKYRKFKHSKQLNTKPSGKSNKSRNSVDLDKYSIKSFHKSSLRRSIGKSSIKSSKSSDWLSIKNTKSRRSHNSIRLHLSISRSKSRNSINK